MSNIQNVAHVTDDELVNVRRAAIEQRATWAAMFYLEAKEAGIDLEPIMRRAIRKVGRNGGEKEKASLGGGPITAKQYGTYFCTRGAPKTFEKEPVKVTEDEFEVDFHYCALVNAWQKMGLDDETRALLCDIAMEGDRGTAETVGLDFELGETIAKGAKTCRLCYKTKK